MIDIAHVSTRMAKLTTSLDVVGRHRCYQRFMCTCVEAIAEKLPSNANEMYQAARAYWLLQTGGADCFDEKRGDCWKVLDELKATNQSNSSIAWAMHIVMCLLWQHAPNDEFDYDNLEWFLGALDKLGDNSSLVDTKLDQAIGLSTAPLYS
jgi:hypothetical protein